MKRVKKLVSVMLAMVMILAMSMTALADGETYTITIDNSVGGHTYEAYQIFTGDLSDNGVLSNVVWGSGVSDAGQAALGDAAVKADSLKTEVDAEAFAKTVSQYLTSPAATSAKGEGVYTISSLAPGYYLVKDADGSLSGEANDSYTRYILEVVKDVRVTPKSDTPEVEKKVKDVNDSVANSTTGWLDSADYDIGDDVPFQLKATLGSDVSKYTTYKVVFHDTLSEGLTYNGDAVVKIGDSTVKGFSVSESNGTLTISCDDVKPLGATDNSVITVEYTATLNEKAVIGSAGNPNKVYLEYSNNPNDEQGGETGKTPEDTVIVFTYQTVVNKVDSNNQPLAGAEFKLEKYDAVTGSWEEITVVKNEERTIFTFSGLDDGQYKLTETTTPEGYNTIDPIYFTVTAEHVVESATPGLTSLSATQTDDTGLDLTEGIIATFTPDVAGGSLSTNIVNKNGAELPSTGGIGTTIFYIIGIVIMAGAVFFLAMNRKKKED